MRRKTKDKIGGIIELETYGRDWMMQETKLNM
jgi:hypothetical protein